MRCQSVLVRARGDADDDTPPRRGLLAQRGRRRGDAGRPRLHLAGHARHDRRGPRGPARPRRGLQPWRLPAPARRRARHRRGVRVRPGGRAPSRTPGGWPATGRSTSKSRARCPRRGAVSTWPSATRSSTCCPTSPPTRPPSTGALRPGGVYFAVMGVHTGSPLMVEWHAANREELRLPPLYDVDDVIATFQRCRLRDVRGAAGDPLRAVPAAGTTMTGRSLDWLALLPRPEDLAPLQPVTFAVTIAGACGRLRTVDPDRCPVEFPPCLARRLATLARGAVARPCRGTLCIRIDARVLAVSGPRGPMAQSSGRCADEHRGGDDGRLRWSGERNRTGRGRAGGTHLDVGRSCSAGHWRRQCVGVRGARVGSIDRGGRYRSVGQEEQRRCDWSVSTYGFRAGHGETADPGETRMQVTVRPV